MSIDQTTLKIELAERPSTPQMEAKKKFKHKRNHKATEWIDGLPIRFLKGMEIILVGSGDVFKALYPFRVTGPLEKEDDEYGYATCFGWVDDACREANIRLLTPFVGDNNYLEVSSPYVDFGKTGRIGYIENDGRAVFGCKTQKDADFVEKALVKGKLLFG
jgi:hypothetical protein